jgi:hypothetical protein
MYTRLIIAPHIDDEILGCFSAIDENCFILYCGCDESKINFNWVKQRPKLQERLDELKSVQNKLRFSYEILNNEVNAYTIQSFMAQNGQLLGLGLLLAVLIIGLFLGFGMVLDRLPTP